MSLKKNLIKNGIASALQKGVKVAEQLLLVPFFISAWGAAYYGEWLTLTIIPTMLGFSDLGFGSAACNSFVLKYAAGDKKGAADTAKSGFFALHILVVSIIVLSIAVLFVLDYFQIFNKSLIDRSQAIEAVFMLMVARTISFYSPLNEAYFRSARKVAYSINLQTIYAGANVIGGLIVLVLKGTIVQFAAVNLLISIVFSVGYAIIAHRILPSERGTIDKSEIKMIFKKGFGFLLSPVWQAIFFQGTTFVVRLTLGPVAVTIFNTVRTLTRSVNQANSMVISSVIPEIQYELASGNKDKSKKIFDRSLYLIISIALSGMLFLYFFGPWFYQIWTHKALNPPAAMWNIFIVSILFNAIWWLSSDLLMSINKPYDFSIIAVITSVIAVLSSFFLSKYFGLIGASFGSCILDITLGLLIYKKVVKYFNNN